MTDLFLERGTTVAIQKSELNGLIARLRSLGYEVIGPKAKDNSIVHAPLETASELPIGYSSVQGPGKYQLVRNGQQNYFDVTTGPHSWKQYFFPPKAELMHFHKENEGWSVAENTAPPPHYAMVGVRPCDLAAIEIQDKVFMQEAWCDPLYRGRRESAFILAVNCLNPCDTCFCASMGTGPEAKGGFDLCLTELENAFLIEVGSEAGRMVLGDQAVTWSPASAFLQQSAKKGLQAAREKMGRELPEPEKLQAQLLANLEHPEWKDVASRCLSCASCTQVCPTCFCWNSIDQTLLPGDTIVREREWDSCFNPDYSYVAHGNTHPNTHARYRQWLTHKFASWYEQFGTSGCTGCGRCITWCPAGIDHIEEIEKIRQGESS
jgi:sulfhydrogenase subunit beta (sulfur reductase)